MSPLSSDQYEPGADEELIPSMLASLPPRLRLFVKYRFLEELDADELAGLGYDRRRSEELEAEALGALRAILSAHKLNERVGHRIVSASCGRRSQAPADRRREVLEEFASANRIDERTDAAWAKAREQRANQKRMGFNRFSRSEIQRFIDAGVGAKPDREVGEALGMRRQSVTAARWRYGIPACPGGRTRAWNTRRARMAPRDERIASMAGRPISEIAAACGVSKHTVARTLDRLGVERSRDTRVLGEQHGMSKLTASQVVEIRRRHRAAGGPDGTAALAKEYGVSESLIKQVVRREIWKEIE